MNNSEFVRCVCPVCKTEFALDRCELPHDYPRDPAGRMLYPCDQKHPLIELWQAWRNWHGVGNTPDTDAGPPRSSPGYSEASGVWD